MKILYLVLILLIVGCQNTGGKFEPTQAEAEQVMNEFMFQVNLGGAAMADAMKLPRPNIELKKMTLQKCKEEKYEGKRVAYCDIETTIIDNGKEETAVIEEMLFYKEDGRWRTPPPSF